VTVLKQACYVRPAGYEDIKVMLTLLKELFSIETDFVFNETKQKAGLKRLIREADSVVLVAERDDLIVGMCTVQTVISTAEGNRSGVIEDMIVHHKFRGQGVGRELLAAVERWMIEQKLNRLQLLADYRNSPALEFYRAQGWKETNMICLRKFIIPEL
jgi:ribosomal protein S18 acetylase RimI-like enzyme